jgi:hypothetical protein
MIPWLKCSLRFGQRHQPRRNRQAKSPRIAPRENLVVAFAFASIIGELSPRLVRTRTS